MRKNGKKLLPMLLAAVLCLGLFPVSAFAAETPASGSASTRKALCANANTYETIEIYLENKDVWMESVDKPFNTQSYEYGLFDLEGDGIPELFLSGIGGSGFFSDNTYYKVDVGTRSVYEMQDLPEDMSYIDLSLDLEIYQDNRSGQVVYYGSDLMRSGWQYNCTVYYLISVDKGAVSTKPLWAAEHKRDMDSDEQRTTYYTYTNGTDRVEVSESDWNQYQERFFNQYTLIAEDVPTRDEKEIRWISDKVVRNIFHEMYRELYDLDTIVEETLLRAKLLATDHSFAFYREWQSPVQIMAKQLDPYASATWYTVENLLETYYKSLITLTDPGDTATIEFYEYLLVNLLDSNAQEYLAVSEPFGMLKNYSGVDLNSVLMEKLVAAGFEAGTKITDENKSLLKDVCVAICGLEDSPDVGWLDTLLVSGKSLDAFTAEAIKIYALTSVSDARAETVKMIGEHTQDENLKKAANNVYSSIREAKKDCISYCLLAGTASGLSEINLWLMDKIVDKLCSLHPASQIWKASVEAATLSMDAIFQIDDIATDTIRILAMANVEKALLNAIDKTEDAFLSSNELEDAQQLLALADTLKQELLAGCDLVLALIDHTERGDLNWHGILDLLSMVQKNKADFDAILKWVFGDPDSEYAQLRKSVTNIRKTVQNANFYAGSVSVLELLRENQSKTPSTWAEGEVSKAINYGFLPSVMQNNYQANITRIEFCALLEYMIESKTGKTALELADELAEEQGGYIKPPFDDALYMEVNDIARLGIITGVGNNMFSPLGEITRQEAATMLYRTANVLGYDASAGQTGYSGVASWASEGVDFVSDRGIMNGTANGFDPVGKYTKEQAILTMVRFYENVK